MSSNKIMSWNDRFALIDHYKPADADVCAAFGVEQGEFETAKQLRAAGTFIANDQLDVSKYAGVFAASAATSTGVPAPATVAPKAKNKGVATTHTNTKTATKAVKVPAKRGRKGDKITKALQAVSATPVSVDTFIKQHGVSLAVLRQSKRFIEKMEPAVAKQIGKVNVRQDKTTKQLMIWREDV